MWSATWLTPAVHVACYNALTLTREGYAWFIIQGLGFNPTSEAENRMLCMVWDAGSGVEAYTLNKTLCRYATHMFEQSSLPPAAEEGGPQVGHTHSDGGGPHGLPSFGLSRHESKLTAMMDDQPDEDYWWDVMHMQHPPSPSPPPPPPSLPPSPPRCNWLMPKGTLGLP